MEDENLEILEQEVSTDNSNIETDNLFNEELIEEKVEEKKEFDPESLDLNIEKDVGGYDFTKFKDDFDLDNQDNLKNLEIITEKYRELGLTQEQFDGLMQMEIDYRNSMLDPAKIQENLVKNLNYEEKVNYKANCNLLKNALEKTGQSALYKTLSADPVAMKVINALINNLGGGRDVNGIKQRETRTNAKLISGTDGVKEFQEYVLKDGADITRKAKEIRAKLINKEALNYFNQIVGE